MLKDIRLKMIVATLTFIVLAGCTGIGPKTVTRDRFDYVNAISNSWKKQMLLNLVKIRFRSDDSRPDDAFVAVQYRDNWFWLDDKDLDSKRTFSFLMMLFSLTETGAQTGAPIVTVPTN